MQNEPNFYDEQCHAYFDGTLTPEEKAAFLAQVKTEPALQEAFHRFSVIHQLLARHASIDPPEGLEKSIMLATAGEKKRPNRSFFPLKVAVSLLLLFSVGITAYLQPWTNHLGEPEVARFKTNQEMPAQVVAAPATLPIATSDSQPISLSPDNKSASTLVQSPPKTSPQASPAASNAEDAWLEAELQETWSDLNSIEQEMAWMDEGTDWIQPIF